MRHEWIDSARGLAVLIAVFAHFHAQFSFGSEFMPDIQFPRWILRMSTPTLLILFGMMIDAAYVRKMRESGDIRKLQYRIVSRIITLYALCILIAITALASGKLSGGEALKAVLNLGDGRFDEILRMYAVLLLFVALLLPAIYRMGAFDVFAIVAMLGWAIRAAFQYLPLPNYFPLHAMFGHGWGFGPAILPSFTFLALGALWSETQRGNRSVRLAMILSGGVVTLFLWRLLAVTPQGFVANLYEWRWTSHPHYYLFGCAAGLMITTVTRISVRPGGANMFGALLRLSGRQSLFIYAFGNIALNALPRVKLSLVSACLAGLIYFGCLLWLAGDREKAIPVMDRLSFGLLPKGGQLYSLVLSQVVALAQGRRD